MRKCKRMICECIMFAIEEERQKLKKASFIEVGVHTGAIRSLVETYLMITRRGRKVEGCGGFIEMDPEGSKKDEEDCDGED